MIRIEVDPEEFAERWCYGEAQHDKAAEAERSGVASPGQHIEALRTQLAWLKYHIERDVQLQIWSMTHPDLYERVKNATDDPDEQLKLIHEATLPFNETRKP